MTKNKGTMLTFFFLLVFIFVSSSLFAGGRKDKMEKPAETLDSWSETFDLTEKKPGKYNIFVTAKDLGQNVSVAGPYNITIDPDSDLPITSITNPIPEMRVAGNLNIVGTSIDDDAVDHVEIIIDDGEPVIADGHEFWSYYLETGNLAEGKHTVKVYGVDIFGVQGHADVVSWHLDRHTPETELLSHEQGVLLAGKVKFQASVFDGNNIESVSYSFDGGETFTPVKFKLNKADQKYNFVIPVDTTKMEDGPVVCWVKSVDMQGSVGIFTFLFFVDNTTPVVEILIPDETEVVNGVFTVSGYAGDKIGLSSLKWKMGDQSGEFELVKGNPWWSQEFDFRNKSDKSATFEITATDTLGNVSSAKKKITIDPLQDLPVVTILSPVPNAKFEGSKLLLAGTVVDDDDPGSILYSIDGGEEVPVVTNGAFAIDLDLPSPGKHTIKVTPVDCLDVKGNTVSVDFIATGNEPKIILNKVSGNASGSTFENDFFDSIEVHPEQSVVISGTATSGSNLKNLVYTIGNMSPVTVSLSGLEGNFQIRLPKDVPYGTVNLEMVLTDTYDRTCKSVRQFYVTNLTKTRKIATLGDLQKQVENTLAAKGLGPLLSSEIPASADGKKPAHMVEATLTLGTLQSTGTPFVQGQEITLPASTAKGDDAIVFTLESNTAYTTASVIFNDDVAQKITLKKLTDTTFEGSIPLSSSMTSELTRFVVSVDLKEGGSLGTGGVISVLRPAPQTGVNDKEAFSWIDAKKSGNKISIDKENPLVGSYTPKTDRRLVSAKFKRPTSGLNVSVLDNQVIVTALSDGSYAPGELVLTDDQGSNFTAEAWEILSDSDLPAITITSPTYAQWIKDTLTLSGSVSDSSGIAIAEYSFDGMNTWQPLTVNRNGGFSVPLSLLDTSDGTILISVRAIDNAGRENVIYTIAHKDTVAPVMRVLVPAAEATINGENRLTFQIIDDGSIESLSFRESLNKGFGQWKALEPSFTYSTMVGTTELPLSDKMQFRIIDKAGNETIVGSWDFLVDPMSDLPVCEIHLPAENEVKRSDFVVSGVVYDDDGVSKVWYQIDKNPEQELEAKTGFSIPIELNSLTDNEHTIMIYAEDIYGVKGDPVVRKFRVSLEEPKAAVSTPSFDETKRGVITMTGWASDKNGIEKVQISIDNGNTFNDAQGTEKWTYTFDTNIIQDGTHVVFVKVWDKYETPALYSSLMNTDNTAPEISVTLPVDTGKTTGTLFLSGNVYDNIQLQDLKLKIRSLSDNRVNIPPALANISLERDIIINKVLDIRSLPDGFYNIEFTGTDPAGNIARASRNIQLDTTPTEDKLNLLYPLNGEHLKGVFNMYGKVQSKESPTTVELICDGESIATSEVSAAGYFKFVVTPEVMLSGVHKVFARGSISNNRTIRSDEAYISYESRGAWVTVDNFTMGDFASERPWLEGTSGYVLTEDEVLALKAKGTSKERRRELMAQSVAYVEISFDNGKTFAPVEAGKKWRYRLETQDMAAGYHFMIVRAVMKNGEIAITRSIVQLDKTAPSIKLISPTEGGCFNTDVTFSGLSSDNLKLESVVMTLRSGDKSSYEVPGFIQGLYFDTHFWGATLYDIGVGLTFFDDNVKLQFQYGQFSEAQRKIFTASDARYGGNVFGGKLLANVATIPFAYFFGPDWAWLSSSVSLGANFSLFTETQRGVAQMLSAVLAQLEFPRITFENRDLFRTVSFYTEFQLWFIPSDVASNAGEKTMLPHITCGLRLNLF